MTAPSQTFRVTSLAALEAMTASDDREALADALVQGIKERAVALAAYGEIFDGHGDLLRRALDRIGEAAKGYATKVNVESLKELMASLRFVLDGIGTEDAAIRKQAIDTLLEIQSRVSFFEREYLIGKSAESVAPSRGGAFHVSLERVAKGGLRIPRTRRPRTILLINPSQESVYGKFSVLPHPSLGLLYVGTALNHAGHRVSILDADSIGLTREALMTVLRDEAIEVVGIITVTPIYNKVVELCAAIKDAFPRIVTVIGGIHPTVSPMQSMQAAVIDYGVKGEGEQTMLDLMEGLNGDRPLADIPGLLYRENGVVRQNRERPLIDDLDSIPAPDWSLLRKSVYSYPDALHHPAFPVFTSRGCPSRCTYLPDQEHVHPQASHAKRHQCGRRNRAFGPHPGRTGNPHLGRRLHRQSRPGLRHPGRDEAA